MTSRRWVVAIAVGVAVFTLAYMLPSTVSTAFEMDEGAVNAYACACSTARFRIGTSSRSTGRAIRGWWPPSSPCSGRASASSARSGLSTAS